MKKNVLRSIGFVMTAAMLMAGCGGNNAASSAAAESTAAAAAETSAATGSADTQAAAADAEGLPTLPADGPEIQVSMGYGFNDDTIGGEAVAVIKEKLEEYSNGKMTLVTYPSGQLGSDREMIESLQMGDLDLITTASSTLVTFVPEVAIFDAPRLLTQYDTDVVKAAFEGEIGDKLGVRFNEEGMELLSVDQCGHMRETSSNKEIRTLEDFKGVRIRTMDNPYFMAMWDAIGASPTPLAFSEIYLSLQQGLIDGQENPYDTLIDTGIYEQQKYIINTDFTVFVNMRIASKQFWDSLDPDYQTVLAAAVDAGTEYWRANQLANTQAALETCINEHGMELIELDDATKDSIDKAAETVWAMIDDEIGAEWLQSLRDSLETANEAAGK